MPKRFVSEGTAMTIVAPSGGTTVGLPLAFGTARVVIPNNTAAEGDSVSCETEGVYEYTAEAGQAWVQGVTPIYFDVANARFTTTASGNVPAGYAWATKESAATSGQVKLQG